MKTVLVSCRLYRHPFPGDCTFRVKFSDGGDYVGVASFRYCLHLDRSPFATETLKLNGRVDGLLVAILIDDEEPLDVVRIEVPNGQVICVRRDQVKYTREEVVVWEEFT